MSYQYDEGARESGPALQKFHDRLYLGPKTYTASGAIRPSGIVMLNNESKIEMTLEAPKSAGQLLAIVQIDAGTAGHTVTAASGTTIDGSDDVATLSAAGDSLLLISRGTTAWVVLSNVGSIPFS